MKAAVFYDKGVQKRYIPLVQYQLSDLSLGRLNEIFFLVSHEVLDQESKFGASLVVHWLRICLAMQRTLVHPWFITCHRATKLCTTTTKPTLWGLEARTTEPTCCNYEACRPQSWCSATREATNSFTPQLESSLCSLPLQLEKALHSNKDAAQPKMNKYLKEPKLSLQSMAYYVR